MHDEVTKALESHPLFESCTREQRAELAQILTVAEYAADTVIAAAGTRGDFMGIILEGRVEIVRVGRDGKRHSMAVIGKGEFFGEIALVLSSPRSADVIAFERTRVLIVPARALSAFLASNPSALALMARTVSQRLEMNLQHEKSLAFDSDVVAVNAADDPYNIRPLAEWKPMKVLVINCGSSSLKYKFYDTGKGDFHRGGLIERIGMKDSRHVYEVNEEKVREEVPVADHKDAFKEMERILTHREKGVLASLDEIDAVGHRVVHGGDRFICSRLLTDDVIEEIRRMVPLAPLHNPVNLAGIEECRKILPRVPQVAVFDTAFHQKMLPYAYLYGLPYSLFEKYRLRRYGFHGTSHSYVAMKAATHLKVPFHSLNIITCHLGNGASICAINHGRSVDTSMGLTPVEGLLMGTRCGDVDPGILLFLSREEKLEAKGLDNLINKESGLKGLSGLSSDMREVMEAAKKGDMKALLAVQVFCYRIKKYIGAYFAALGGVDVLVFTGGIGQGSVEVRARVCQGLQHMGIILNEERNRSPEPSADGISRVSGDESKVPVLVVPTDEELMIARETVRALQFCEAKERIRKQDRIPIPVATVGKYARLSANDRDFLFGPDYGLRPRFKLSQPGEFLAEECVTLVGRKNTIATVPILLPMAAESEISLSQQEEFILGIDAPVRISGDIDGTPGITLEGPMGRVTIDRGVIQHRRHLHIAPEDALKLDLKHHDLVSMEIQGKASARLDDVVVEIAPGANLELHIDDFEAQSLDISAESIAFIDGVYERKF